MKFRRKGNRRRASLFILIIIGIIRIIHMAEYIIIRRIVTLGAIPSRVQSLNRVRGMYVRTCPSSISSAAIQMYIIIIAGNLAISGNKTGSFWLPLGFAFVG
jgi:hypothetical protein